MRSQLALTTLIGTFLASTLAAPTVSSPKRHLTPRSLDINPDVDLDLLQNFQDLCIGIAVCNPVTVTSSKSRRDLLSLDISPDVDVGVLNALSELCIGIAVCNPVSVATTNVSSSAGCASK